MESLPIKTFDAHGNHKPSGAPSVAAGAMAARDRCWTESLAVGSSGILDTIRPLILSRLETEIVETDSDLWVLKETAIPYGQ